MDAVGAGDALLAYASLAMVASGGNEAMASVLGCVAAGLECEYDGNETVIPEAILKRLARPENESNYSAG